MMPRDKGGVVDHTLKVSWLCLHHYDYQHYVSQVYGTNNIRVVDLSVVPLHFAGHTQCMCHPLRPATDSDTGPLPVP